jgi:hypothetical protein
MSPFEEWCRLERQRLHHRLNLLDAGRLRIAHDEGAGWIDRTDDRRRDIAGRLQEVDELLGDAPGGRGD